MVRRVGDSGNAHSTQNLLGNQDPALRKKTSQETLGSSSVGSPSLFSKKPASSTPAEARPRDGNALSKLNRQLFKATEKGNIPEVARLLSEGADPNGLVRPSLIKRDKLSPMHVAATPETVELLKRNPYNPDKKGSSLVPGVFHGQKGMTPMHVAAERDVKIIKNQGDEAWMTDLHMNSEPIENAAQFNPKNDDGQTPADVARKAKTALENAPLRLGNRENAVLGAMRYGLVTHRLGILHGKLAADGSSADLESRPENLNSLGKANVNARRIEFNKATEKKINSILEGAGMPAAFPTVDGGQRDFPKPNPIDLFIASSPSAVFPMAEDERMRREASLIDRALKDPTSFRHDPELREALLERHEENERRKKDLPPVAPGQ